VTTLREHSGQKPAQLGILLGFRGCFLCDSLFRSFSLSNSTDRYSLDGSANSF